MGLTVSVDSKLWNSIYYPIRDHLIDGMPFEPNMSVVKWVEIGFLDMGMRLYNDGSGVNRVWTHVEISDEVDIVELMMRWS